MVLPLYTDDPLAGETKPYVTWGLIAANFIVFMAMLTLSEASQAALVNILGFIPAIELRDAPFSGPFPRELTSISSAFLHANAGHILGNMLFLWIFGDDIEDALGHLRFLVFYILCGIGGTLGFLLAYPHSATVLIGASGAISGVLAAFLMLRPCAKVEVLVYIWPFGVRAFYVIGLWILLQLWSAARSADNGVAYWAHVGGAITGALLILVIRPVGLKLLECVWPTKEWDAQHGRTRWWALEHVLLGGAIAVGLIVYVAWVSETAEDRQTCAHDAGDAKIAACTRIISAGEDKDGELAKLYFNRGQGFAGKDEYDKAIADYDQAIRLNPNDAAAFNSRCWSRAILGRLQEALSDCNESLRLQPGQAATLDSRGLTFLKMGLAVEAIADYDSVLLLNSRFAGSLYGRGIAKLKIADIQSGNLDIAAAKSIEPGIAEQFAKYGVLPDGTIATTTSSISR